MADQQKFLGMMRTSKMAFDYNFTMMLATYEQNKLLLHSFMAQSGEVPQELREATDNWLIAYRKGCEEFKKMVDEGYAAVEKTLSEQQ
jgi:hypothetical protein